VNTRECSIRQGRWQCVAKGGMLEMVNEMEMRVGGIEWQFVWKVCVVVVDMAYV